MVYKDRQPCETVDCIKNYLSDDYALTFSCLSSNTGQVAPSYILTNYELGLITNGKGTTKEYAQASAFGEMFERLFNIAFVRFGNITPIDLGIEYPCPYYDRAEVKTQMEKIAVQEMGDKVRAEILAALFLELVDAYYGEVLQKIPCIIFKNFYAESVFLPLPIADILVGTNGMAAGNTFEEAFIQAFSEIMERKAIKDLNAGLVVPDVIEDKLQDVSVLKTLKDCMKEEEHIFFKTFTFERHYHFPVVALLVVDLNQKKYKIKFGAHWNLAYALERCATEIVQGAEIQDYSKWISIRRACCSDTGENMKVFTDGMGTISNIALNNLLLAEKTYGTDWISETNLDAFNIIKEDHGDVFYTINKLFPVVSLQLFILNWSYISWPTENELKYFIDKYKVTRQLQQFIKKNKKTIEDVRKIYNLLSERFNLSTNLNFIAQFLCPIQLQYLSLITVEDLALIVNTANHDYLAVSEYFHKKSKKDPSNEYSYYAEIYAYNIGRNELVSDSIRAFFTDSVIKRVEKDFATCFETLLCLDYCKKCSRKGYANCILEEKKRVCRLILEDRNEDVST